MSSSANREDEVHIASFILQHRAGAADLVAMAVSVCPDLELALVSTTGSVVVCESEDRLVLTERIDTLRNVPGVLNVLLVYHHAEPRTALDQLIGYSLQAE